MKKTKLITLLLSLFVLPSLGQDAEPLYALIEFPSASIEKDEECDACGCAATGGNFGFGDIFQQNSLSVRYLYQAYQSKETIFNDSPWSTERFHTTQILGLIKITEKLKSLVIVPYHFLQKETTTENYNLQGLGDVSLLGIYQLFQKTTENNSQHLWNVGAGIKLPTGNFENELRGAINPGFQLGSGSIDYSILSEYQWRKEKWIWHTLLNYNIKTANKYDFQFGNQWSFNSQLHYTLTSNQSFWIPQVGYAFENSDKNIDFGVAIPNSNAYVHMAKIGTEYRNKQWIAGVHFFKPLYQNMINEAVKLNFRSNIYIQYVF